MAVSAVADGGAGEAAPGPVGVCQVAGMGGEAGRHVRSWSGAEGLAGGVRLVRAGEGGKAGQGWMVGKTEGEGEAGQGG